MKNNLFSVLKKELREVFRDKKSLAMMLIIPILIPLIVIGMSSLFESQQEIDTSSYNKVGFAYELSTIEKELLKGINIEYTYASLEEIKEMYNREDVYVYITKNLNEYTIHFDNNNEASSYTYSLANMYLESYKGVLQSEYLENNNVDASLVLNIIEIRDESENTANNFYQSYITSYAFLFIIMAITVSATYPATDTTAGEKERGTLETLLTFPVQAKDIILAKLLGVTLSSVITGILSLVLSLISLKYVGSAFSVYEGINIMPSFGTISLALLIIILYSFFISGLCIAIASKSKTFKEAQSALTPLTFISLFPGMIAFMANITTTTLLSIVPFINFTLIFNDACVGTFNALNILLMLISTIVYIAIIINLIVKQYKSEKILFSIE